MSSPRVTAVLPTFNRGSSFDAAVESVLGQTMWDLELIVVDDASDEQYRPQPDCFIDPRVKIIQRMQNGGVAAAQNSGLREASGEFISFIHSDDVWRPRKLVTQLAVSSESPDAGAVESATLRVGSGAVVEHGPQLVGVSYERFVSRAVRNVHIAGWMFRTDVIRDVGGFNERLRAYEDFDLLTRLLRQHSVAFSHDVVAEIDQRGPDRLGSSPWMARARATLLEIYEPELLERFGHLPPGWRDWSVMLAIAALERNESEHARQYLRSANRGRPVEAIKRSPLYAFSMGGQRVSAFGAQLARRYYGSS